MKKKTHRFKLLAGDWRVRLITSESKKVKSWIYLWRKNVL